ncbi:MAG: DUF1080 domain-containing protein [Chitinophagaceae bacterium]
MKSKFYLLIFIAFSSILIAMSFKPLEADNVLSESEKKEGWKLLFDGQTMNSWRTYNNRVQNSWEVRNGQLHIKMDSVAKHCDLITKEQYQDFELRIDWKIEAAANSGIIYHALETHDASYETGPEYQIIDDSGYPGKLEDWQKSGADYAMHPPLSLQAKPVGEYNHTRIIVKSNHVEHWLNGIKVADFETGTPGWLKLKNEGKWKDYPDYAAAKKGYIALQDHGGGVWFKNIKIRKL